MAGPTNTKSEFIYVNMFQGKFIIRCEEDSPDPEKRKRKLSDGREIWEVPYGKLEEMTLADIRIDRHDQFGESFEWIMIADNQYYLLRFGMRSPVMSMVMNRLENIAVDKPFTLNAWKPKDEDKTVITIWQNGAQVTKARERDKNLPPAKQITVNNELVWDFSDQINLYKEIVSSIRPHLPGVSQSMAAVAQEQSEPAPATSTAGPSHGAGFKEEPHGPATDGKGDGKDDLPF